jgi:hypothetical protein
VDLTLSCALVWTRKQRLTDGNWEVLKKVEEWKVEEEEKMCKEMKESRK